MGTCGCQHGDHGSASCSAGRCHLPQQTLQIWNMNLLSRPSTSERWPCDISTQGTKWTPGRWEVPGTQEERRSCKSKQSSFTSFLLLALDVNLEQQPPCLNQEGHQICGLSANLESLPSTPCCEKTNQSKVTDTVTRYFLPCSQKHLKSVINLGHLCPFFPPYLGHR